MDRYQEVHHDIFRLYHVLERNYPEIKVGIHSKGLYTEAMKYLIQMGDVKMLTVSRYSGDKMHYYFLTEKGEQTLREIVNE